jgi:mannose-6-phosphate isomerase-like protein (cupin superfamily)
MPGPRDLDAIAAGIDEPWKPVDVVTVNDAVIRMAKIHGEFPWHHHDEDELFLCWQGRFVLEQEGDEGLTLEQGQVYVVPRGVEHRPVAPEPAVILMIERPETKQYGNP